jgi:tetratricopeptide (TPR) repeat protein
MTSDSNEGLQLVGPPTSGETQRFRRSVWMLKEIQESLQLIPDKAERYYSLALMDVMLGRFTEAISNLDRTIQANPEHVLAMALAGELHLKLGDHKKAAMLLEQVVNREPDNMTAITWLCLAYHCLGYKGKAQMQQSILQSVAPDLIVSVLNK